MLQTATAAPARRTLEFGIYRDGDNNLDVVQEATLSQALQTSRRDARIEFTVEDTTSLHGGELHTDQFTIADGGIGRVRREDPQKMSDADTLVRFVAHTLDNAEINGAKQTWIDLVDHGGGDGGGLQTSDGRCMPMPAIALAVADGIALHAREHPEDAGRGVDGVVANQCLMDTMGFADALSHAGVKWLAASPETMLAPGVPSGVAHAIASHETDPQAMSEAIVSEVMNARYDAGGLGTFGPAAAFDVLDLDGRKIDGAESAIRRFNDVAVAEASRASVRASLRSDVRAIDGMARFPGAGSDMPWHADRPAMAVYDTIASDGRLDATLRRDAAAARDAVGALVLAHRESDDFRAFGGSDYSDSAGPTVHVPLTRRQIDPWAKRGISETDNAFYRSVHQDAFVRAVA